MISIYTIISEARIPNQLKLYFNDSDDIREHLNEEKIKILEELTIYFYCIYTFDTPQYCAAVVSAFRRSKGVDSFYDFLKRVIEIDLKLTPGGNFENINLEIIFINRDSLNNVFREATVLFIDNIERISKNENVDLAPIYIYLGKIDLIVKNTNELHFVKLKETAEYIISECLQSRKDL